jgi:hypothetical protein
MKIVQRIPHPYLSVSVFIFNDNYLLKIQLGSFEQVLRFPLETVSDPSELADILENAAWLDRLKNNFLNLKLIQEEFLASFQGKD